MAELQWTPAVARPASLAWSGLWRRLAGRFLDWEDWLTLALALAAVLSVSLSLEAAGWSTTMPALSLVGVLALLLALFLARSPLSALLAWPLAAVAGAATVFWQTMEMVGPGDLGQRVDAIYFRFQTWFHAAFTGGISNDPLPFNVMVVGLTWLGVFMFGWSLYRWHNVWLGLIPGGVALFTQLAFVGEAPLLAILMYVLLGFLLVMRANLMARMRQWRAEGVDYPPLISLSFLHYSVWAALFLIAAAWIAPVGPFPTPKPVDALVERLEGIGVHFVRLAGPLRVKKITPIHNYTAILPFQGSIDLGERELLSVKVDDPSIRGPITLRGAVYDEYASGGWKAGPRQEVELGSLLEERVRAELAEGSLEGRLLTLTVEVEAKSVVGTVLFSPGKPVSAGVPARFDTSPANLMLVPVDIPGGGADLSDEEVLRDWWPQWLPPGVSVERDQGGRVVAAQVVVGADTPLPDALVVRPRERLAEGESYRVVGLLQTAASDELRQGGWGYPAPISDQYLGLPDTVPARVSELAWQVAGGEVTPYDRAKAIESYLRRYPVDYAIAETPPGKDAVDHFLFESKRGYFNYHASAMVVMLRAVGVPSRLAVGFVIDQDDFQAESGAYVVRDANAYAWAEVYIVGHGWVEFNPSPERPAELRPGEGADDGGALPESLVELPDLPTGLEDVLFLRGAGPSSGAAPTSASGGPGTWYVLWIALAAAAFAGALAVSVALGWQRSVAGLPYPQQLWEKAVRLASWAGQPPQSGQTPAEFARRLERAFRGVRGIPILASAYNRSRFGRQEPDGQERELLRRHWPHLRSALLAAIIRRLWPFHRVRSRRHY